VDMLLLLYFVLDGNVFLAGCSGGMFVRDMILKGISVLIFCLIGVVIVVYVSLLDLLTVGFDSGG
jgi:hypothetical protein